jgi:plastocyanin
LKPTFKETAVSDDSSLISRRNALKCMAYGGAGTLFTLSGGILTPVDLARGAAAGSPLFVQISDTHIGFKKDANPDVAGTLGQTIDLINGLAEQPSLIIHTGDITHLSKPEEFDLAQQLMSRLRVTELHTVPGEHDVSDSSVSEYFNRFGKASANKGYYSFDHAGVHFIGLVNVLEFKPGGLGTLGAEQLAWVAGDLKMRSASTPIVVFAHMPLWSVYDPWGWGTGDSGQLLESLRRFGSVTILNGHIHQIVQKVEGNITFHTARSTAYPQPTAGEGAGPGPLKVPAEQLSKFLGITRASLTRRPRTLTLADLTLQAPDAARITIKDFMFSPDSLDVPAGSNVTWSNLDQEPHTIVSTGGLFRSGALDTDQSYSFRFDKPGSYQFSCSIHPRMVGTIVVQSNPRSANETLAPSPTIM